MKQRAFTLYVLTPGFFYVEYDPDLIKPEQIGMRPEDVAKMKALGYFGGSIFPIGAVTFKTMSDEELKTLGLKRLKSKQSKKILVVRELDALIAEEVMGWRIFPDGPNGEMHTIDANQCECHEYDIPHYSTDIAAAWEVVEKLKTIGLRDFNIELSSGSEHLNEWEVSIYWLDDEQRHGPFYFSSDSTNSAPYVICLAALKAVEGK